MVDEILLSNYECLRCGHIWIPRRSVKPKVCPKCKNVYWDVPKKDGVEKGGIIKGGGLGSLEPKITDATVAATVVNGKLIHTQEFVKEKITPIPAKSNVPGVFIIVDKDFKRCPHCDQLNDEENDTGRCSQCGDKVGD